MRATINKKLFTKFSDYRPLGIGVDIERTSRFFVGREDKKNFLEKIYTEKELDYCYSKKNYAQHLASRFAGKEAVCKAISGKHIQPIMYNAIEIARTGSGAPKVNFLHNKFRNVKVALSLSHSADNAIAFAVAYKKI